MYVSISSRFHDSHRLLARDINSLNRVTVASIVRLSLLVQFLFLSKSDRGFVISGIESNLAIIATSIPAVYPLLRSREHGGWRPKKRRLFGGGTDSSDGGEPDIGLQIGVSTPKSSGFGSPTTPRPKITGLPSPTNRDRSRSRSRVRFEEPTRDRSKSSTRRSKSTTRRRGAISKGDIRILPSAPQERSSPLPPRIPSPQSGDEQMITVRSVMREINEVASGMEIGPGSYGSRDVPRTRAGAADELHERSTQGKRPSASLSRPSAPGRKADHI